MSDPVLLILTGATGNEDGRQACQEIARAQWPGARVFIPNYLSRFRGVRGVGAWVDRWCEAHLQPGDSVYVFAFILGGAALPFAPGLVGRVRRFALLRSRYQEGVPRFLRRRLGAWLTTLLIGKAVADLGEGPFWPPEFRLPAPNKTFLETRPTRLVNRFGIAPLTDEDLGLSEYQEMPVDHDFAYHSRDLMKAVVDWLRQPS